jgi:glycosyl transferase family 25
MAAGVDLNWGATYRLTNGDGGLGHYPDPQPGCLRGRRDRIRLGADCGGGRKMTYLILVISLKDALDRRIKFSQRALETDLIWSFYDASRELDSELRYDERLAIVNMGRPLNPAELGCYSSHYGAWRFFINSSFEKLIVLEDDVIVDWAMLKKIVHADATWKYKYGRLFWKHPCPCRIIETDFIDSQRFLIQIYGVPYGTQGYWMSRSGAETFLNHCRSVKRPIDDEMDRAWAHKAPNLATFPPLVIEGVGDSGIGDRKIINYRIGLFNSLRFYINNIKERVWRKMYWYISKYKLMIHN